jgi:hypothetical protein
MEYKDRKHHHEYVTFAPKRPSANGATGKPANLNKFLAKTIPQLTKAPRRKKRGSLENLRNRPLVWR